MPKKLTGQSISCNHDKKESSLSVNQQPIKQDKLKSIVYSPASTDRSSRSVNQQPIKQGCELTSATKLVVPGLQVSQFRLSNLVPSIFPLSPQFHSSFITHSLQTNLAWAHQGYTFTCSSFLRTFLKIVDLLFTCLRLKLYTYLATIFYEMGLFSCPTIVWLDERMWYVIRNKLNLFSCETSDTFISPHVFIE